MFVEYKHGTVTRAGVTANALIQTLTNSPVASKTCRTRAAETTDCIRTFSFFMTVVRPYCTLIDVNTIRTVALVPIFAGTVVNS